MNLLHKITIFFFKFTLRATFILTYVPYLKKIILNWKIKKREKLFKNKTSLHTKKSTSKSILLAINNFGLGDCILLRLPISLLQEKYPNYQFYFYFENESGKNLLAEFYKNIRYLSWTEVKKKDFTIVYDLMLNELPSVLKLLNIKTFEIKGIGFGYKRFYYDTWYKPKNIFNQGHIIDYWLYLFQINPDSVKKNESVLGKYYYLNKLKSPNDNTTLILKKKKGEKIIVFAPFTGYDKNGKINLKKILGY